MKSRGVDLPDDVEWYVAEHQGLSLREAGLEWVDENGAGGADALYYRMRLTPHNIDDPIQWEEFVTASGIIPVVLRGEVLCREDHTLYVMAHELFELHALRLVIESRGGTITRRDLAFLIEPRLGGTIHVDAVRHADELVRQYRTERGLEP